MTRFSFAPVAPDLALDVLYVMGVAMRADGRIEPGERKALDAAARALGLGSLTMPTERPNVFRLDRSAEDRGLLFAAAVWMIIADSAADTKERELLADLASRLRLDEIETHRLAKLAKESFGITGADGHQRDWTTAFAMLVQAIQDPGNAELE
ncbi:MAG: hypothetical protein OHK0013_01360 [Sandaracinaceae bacterium]